MAADQEQTDSVYDFLYVDSRRLGLLLSQFGTDGVPTELVRSAEENAETSGELSIKFAKLGKKDSGKSSLTRRFDPRWLIPLTFLDEAQDWMQRDLSQASLGQLILLKVGIGVQDVGFMKKLWDAPWVQHAIAASIPQDNLPNQEANRASRRREERQVRKPPAKEPDLTALVGTLMGMMPHAVQSTFVTGEGKVLWGTLSDDHLVGSATDLLLKHGTSISGEWYVVAILDAMPNGTNFEELRSRVDIEQSSSQIYSIMQHFKPMLDLGFSRPSHAYGVTPLVIFREIGNLWTV